MSIYLSYYLELKNKQKTGKKLPTLDEIKRYYIQYLLDVTENNLKETAKILDVPQSSLKMDTNK